MQVFEIVIALLLGGAVLAAIGKNGVMGKMGSGPGEKWGQVATPVYTGKMGSGRHAGVHVAIESDLKPEARVKSFARNRRSP
jgi:hypothetical protein